ncbi:MAG: hypothetical protein GY941_25490, partial [Planctomycetes bacterium]|nr:hypothetical protein [Planctomycetota bacterium]
NPLGQGKETGNSIIVDEHKIKKIHKMLYEEAVYFRFHLLLDQWAVIDFAQKYLNNFINKDGQHPLLLRMQLELKSKVADYKEVDQFCVKVINDPQTSGTMASVAFSKLSDILSKLKYAPQVTKKLDNRPFHLYHRGFMFQDLYNYDMAEDAYRTGLSLNKYEFRFYKHLAQVTKEYTPICKAVDEFPLNFRILKESGNYMAQQNDDDLQSKAMEYYKAARHIMPSEKTLAPKIANILTKQEKYHESIDVLNQWLEDHGSKGPRKNNFTFLHLIFRPFLSDLQSLNPLRSLGYACCRQFYELLRRFEKSHSFSSTKTDLKLSTRDCKVIFSRTLKMVFLVCSFIFQYHVSHISLLTNESD